MLLFFCLIITCKHFPEELKWLFFYHFSLQLLVEIFNFLWCLDECLVLVDFIFNLSKFPISDSNHKLSLLFFSLFKQCFYCIRLFVRTRCTHTLLLVMVTITSFSYCVTLQNVFLVLNQITCTKVSFWMQVQEIIWLCVNVKCVLLSWKNIANIGNQLSKMKPVFQQNKIKFVFSPWTHAETASYLRIQSLG